MISMWNKPALYNAPPVDFALYIEALCPDCKNFITAQLWPAWQKIGDIMNLTIVPFGNGYVSTFICTFNLLYFNILLQSHTLLLKAHYIVRLVVTDQCSKGALVFS